MIGFILAANGQYGDPYDYNEDYYGGDGEFEGDDYDPYSSYSYPEEEEFFEPPQAPYRDKSMPKANYRTYPGPNDYYENQYQYPNNNPGAPGRRNQPYPPNFQQPGFQNPQVPQQQFQYVQQFDQFGRPMYDEFGQPIFVPVPINPQNQPGQKSDADKNLLEKTLDDFSKKQKEGDKDELLEEILIYIGILFLELLIVCFSVDVFLNKDIAFGIFFISIVIGILYFTDFSTQNFLMFSVYTYLFLLIFFRGAFSFGLVKAIFFDVPFKIIKFILRIKTQKVLNPTDIKKDLLNKQRLGFFASITMEGIKIDQETFLGDEQDASFFDQLLNFMIVFVKFIVLIITITLLGFFSLVLISVLGMTKDLLSTIILVAVFTIILWLWLYINEQINVMRQFGREKYDAFSKCKTAKDYFKWFGSLIADIFRAFFKSKVQSVVQQVVSVVSTHDPVFENFLNSPDKAESIQIMLNMINFDKNSGKATILDNNISQTWDTFQDKPDDKYKVIIIPVLQKLIALGSYKEEQKDKFYIHGLTKDNVDDVLDLMRNNLHDAAKGVLLGSAADLELELEKLKGAGKGMINSGIQQAIQNAQKNIKKQLNNKVNNLLGGAAAQNP